MTDRSFKYRREDFGPLPVQLHHLDIYINFLEDRVETVNSLDLTTLVRCSRIELDACGLEVYKVEWMKEGEPALPLAYDYKSASNRLTVHLPREAAAGERLGIRTFTACIPSDHILEGIYRDSTPPGAPQQYMSQCQQWGFQRIMPIFDDCRAKCTMTTTIEADAAYTHLISNGNIDRTLNPDGRPILKPGAPGRQIITYHNPVPMAPYLFIVCAGTWDALVDRVTYDSRRTVHLEYLVPPGSVEEAKIPMEILKKAILWVKETQGYEYTGETYRTICMNKSNFGGMENVGNTTIVTDAALINEHTLDTSLLYAHAVIVHEFEHNQCGSETTMETPFDVWLNEAFTVDVERQFMADTFDPSFIRLHQLYGIRNPLLGPLAMEDGGHVGRIVRQGFNNPDELIDGVTYVKAAEVIRMLKLIVGPRLFQEGKDLYFSRYRHGNANTDQFFECFEEVSGRSLQQFKEEWLHRIGYPGVSASTEYSAEKKRLTISFRQDFERGENAFHVPIRLALVGWDGKDLEGTDQVFELRERESKLILEGIAELPALVSMNRECSFYGTFRHENLTEEDLIRQIRLDPNACARVDAMRQLTDLQRIRLLNDPGAEIDPRWLTLYGGILNDFQLPSALKAYFLRIDEQPMDRGYCTWYLELVAARDRMMKVINDTWKADLIKAYRRLDTFTKREGQPPSEGIEDRMLKQVLLDLISVEDSQETHRLILDHFASAAFASDRVAALLALNRSSSPERRRVLEEVYRQWHGHLSGYANYLRVISSGTRDDVFEMIEKEKNRPTFDMTQPTWCRALFLPMAVNNRMVWRPEGVRWIADTVIELAPVNATTASRLLNTFQNVGMLKPDLQERVVPALERIVRGVSDEQCPTVHGQAKTYLDAL